MQLLTDWNVNLTQIVVEPEDDDRDLDKLKQQVLINGECVVSFPGASQYTEGKGVSACGIAALNCVRVIFNKEQQGLKDTALLTDIMSRETMEEITSICGQWQSQSHLEVEVIYQTPIFETSFELRSSKYSRPSDRNFERLLLELQDIKPSAAAVITRPPEIVTCLKVTTSKEPIFIIFDSHPRPKHPDGAAMIFYSSIEAAATYLGELLAIDEGLLSDSHMQWQAQLLANFCAHIFVSRGATTHSDLTQAVLRSSLAILSLQDELAELRFQNGALTSENRRLETETEEAETRHNKEVTRLEKELIATKSLLSSRTNGRDHFASQNDPGPSSSKPYTDYPVATPANKGKMKSTLEFEWLDPFQMDVNSECSEIQRITDTQAATSSNGNNKSKVTFEWLDPQALVEDHANAERSEMQPGKHLLSMDIPADREEPTTDTPLEGRMRNSMPCAWLDPETIRELEMGQEEQDNARLAAQKQREYAAEDAALRREREELERSQLPMFDCMICMEELPEDFIARVEKCQHEICRNCVRAHIMSWIMEHRFPIFCPICMAGKVEVEPAVLDTTFIQQVGIPQDAFEIYDELQMAMFSVVVHCRRCQQTVFVDREEHEAERILVCPLPGCNYVWCKLCQHEVTVGGPQHSCDGSSELNHLMEQQGWKHCPGCQTPIQKDSGCNHMTCLSPGCNTHFCYTCGESIVRSSLRLEIKEAVSTHYRRDCLLF